jgi:hypothetical protein
MVMQLSLLRARLAASHAARRTWKYLASQGAAQVLGFTSGILIVRNLPKDDYAHYSIATAVLATLTLLGDAGMSAILMSGGAQRLADSARLAALFREARRFKLRLGSAVGLAGSAFIVFLLRSNGTTWPQTALIVALCAVTLWPIYSIAVTQTYHRLRLDITRIRRTALYVAALRCAVVALVVVSGSQSVTLLLVVNLACSAITAVAFGRPMRRDLGEGKREPSLREDFARAARRVFPMTLLLVSGEQIFLAILSIRSTPEVVAETNAMSRFAIAFFVVNAAVADIAAPRLARARGRTAVGRWLVGSLLLYLAFAAAVVLATAALATPLLSLLGPGYAGLEVPLITFAVGFALFYLGYAWDTLNQGRGWINGSWAYIPGIVVWTAWCYWVADLAKAGGSAIAFAALSIPMLITQVVRTSLGYRKAPREESGVGHENAPI